MNCAVDSHCHVFDAVRFPFAAGASCKPSPSEQGTAEQLAALLDVHRVGRALLVNPTSGYGYDNRCLVDALRAFPARFKGVARVPPDIAESELAKLKVAGVIGIRLDLIADGVGVLHDRAAARLLALVRELGWQVHVQCEKDQLAEAAPFLLDARVPLVVDHCGRPDVARGTSQPGFQALLRLGREGHALKLSGPFRFSRRPAPHDDVEPFIAAAIEAFTPRRCVFGSDWPFVRLPERPEYGATLARLRRWIPDDDERGDVLCATPARLFGF